MKGWGLAVRATVPEKEALFVDYYEHPFQGAMSREAFNTYRDRGGKLSDQESFDSYRAYCDQEWVECESYSIGHGCDPYGWRGPYMAESFTEWLAVELSGGIHKRYWAAVTDPSSVYFQGDN